jgi:non-heme chloroperoxidase
MATTAMLSSKLVKGAALKIYPGGTHGLSHTHKEKLNADLLAFIEARAQGADAALLLRESVR